MQVVSARCVVGNWLVLGMFFVERLGILELTHVYEEVTALLLLVREVLVDFPKVL